MLAAVGISAASGIIGGLSSYDKKKDANRIATNGRAFALANSVAGDRNAFLFLKYRSGKFGSTTILPIVGVTPGGEIGGWADNGNADEDAYAKYKQLAQRYEAALSTTTAALPDQVVDPTNVGKAPDGTVLGAPQGASMGPMFLIVVAIGLGLVIFTRVQRAEA